MAALVPAGAPVSVLIDHGLAEKIVEKLIARRRRHRRETGVHDARGAGSAAGHRAGDDREDPDGREQLLRSVRRAGGPSGAESGEETPKVAAMETDGQEEPGVEPSKPQLKATRNRISVTMEHTSEGDIEVTDAAAAHLSMAPSHARTTHRIPVFGMGKVNLIP